MERFIFFFILFGLLVVGSCSKNIEQEPLEQLTYDQIFDPDDKNGEYARQFLNAIYANMPDGFNRISGDLLACATDDAVPSRDGSSIENLSKSRINAQTNPDEAWSKNYTGIRQVNVFLSNIDRVPVVEAEKGFWKAEARFLRALFYFELVKRHGGVPLVGDVVFRYTDDLQLARSTFRECVDYIVDECDAIADLVRTEPLDGPNWGRISKGAVLALKAKLLLYAASPLFNGDAADAGNELAGYPEYDPARWQAAATAAKDVMDLDFYGLESNYLNLFTTRRSSSSRPEVILAHMGTQNAEVEDLNGPVGFTNAANGEGRTSPTQNLVDEFPMKNGKKITDPTSGYDPLNPYENRDNRLQYNVLFNGVKWLGRPLETFEGGRDKPNTNVIQTKTGYYMRKFMGNFTNASEYANQHHNFVVFRYADILLMFAEAENEAAGPSDEVYQVLKDLRARAGIEAGADSMYGLQVGMTQTEMREAIRNERRIEMAFEEQRYWDVRRWKIAEDVFNQERKGMKISKVDDASFAYESVIVDQMVFKSNMYLYPIPFAEIAKNSNLVQNYGW